MLSACCSSTILPISCLQALIVLISRVWDCWVPVTHRYFQNQFAGAVVTEQVTQTSSRRSSMKILSFVLFRSSWSVMEPSWGQSGICVAFGVVFFYFGSIVGPWLYLDDVMLYSCIVWCGDCKPTMYLFPLCITWVVWRLPHLRQCFQCGCASKSCFDTWEI